MKKNPTDRYHSNNPQDDTLTIPDENVSSMENFSFNAKNYGQREKSKFYEKVAAFCSSWKFIALMASILMLWVCFSLILWLRW